MRIKLLLLLLCVAFVGRAQTLSTFISGTVLCEGPGVPVVYHSEGATFNSGNVFSVQLSDDQGSFANPVTLGQLSSTAVSGTVQAVIPAGTAGGSGYRIRVVSSNPVVVGDPQVGNVKIMPKPVAYISSSSVCPGQPVYVSASGLPEFTYEWHSNGWGGFGFGQTDTLYYNNSSNSPQSLIGNVTVSIPGVIGGSCTLTDTFLIEVLPRTNPDFSYPSVKYCQSDPANPTPSNSGGATGIFSSTPAGLSINSSSGQINLSQSQPGTYDITFTTTLGSCTASSTKKLTVYTVPDACFSYLRPVFCAGQAPVLCTGANPGTFTAYPAGLDIDSNTGVIYANPNIPGLYNVVNTIAATGGCPAASDTFQVEVLSTLQPSAPIPFTNFYICPGEALELSAAGPSNGVYKWMGYSNHFTYYINNNTPDHIFYGQMVTVPHEQISVNYSVTVSVNGCESPIGLLQNVTTIPIITTPVALNNGPICEGEALRLSAIGAWTQGTTFTWTGPDGSNYTSTQKNPVRFNATPAMSGTYTVVAVSNGCESEPAYTTVTVGNTSSATISGNAQLCPGQSLSLTAASGSQGPYSWSGPNNFSATGSVVTVPNLPLAGFGTYSVSSTSGQCTYSGTIEVGRPQAPGVSGSGVFCVGGTITLSAWQVPGATGYSWVGPNGFTSSQQTAQINNATAARAGMYTAYAVYSGCLSEPAIFQVTNAATASISASSSGPVNQGSTLFLSASGPAGMYSWSGPDNFQATGTNPYIQIASPVNAGNYTATLQAPGCATLAAVTNVQVVAYSQISGLVFNDSNNNGIQDYGEEPKQGVMVNLQPGNKWAITNGQGLYTLYALPGSHTISLATPYASQVVSPVNHTVTISGSGQVISNKNFGIYTPPVLDVSISVSSGPPVPGFPIQYNLHFKNKGNIAASGQVKFVPAAEFTFTSANGNYTTSGDTIIWNYSNMPAGSTFIRGVDLFLPAGTALGSTVTSFAFVTPVSTDAYLVDNSVTYQQTVVGSYDPNDKQVQPIAGISPGYIAAGKPLTYTIRFQNTGTAPAVNVLLVDTLSDKLEISSFRMLSASHNYNLNLRDGRVMEWKFNNIMLPYSNSNEPASHGYVQFQIKPKNSLAVGEEIQNTAHIYFDFNAAIVTNTTHTVVDLVSAPEPEKELAALQLYPNPNTGSFTIQLSDCQPGNLQVRVINVLGQQVYAEAVSTNNTALEHQLQLHELPEGLYLVQVQQGETVRTARLILQK